VAVQAACRALYPTQCNGVYTPTEVKVAGQTLTYNVELYCPCTDPAGDDTVVLASPPPSPASPSPSPPVSTASSPPPVSAANSAPVYAADYAATGAELTEAPVVESVDGVRAVAHVTPLHPMRQWVAQGGSQGSRRRGGVCRRGTCGCTRDPPPPHAPVGGPGWVAGQQTAWAWVCTPLVKRCRI
jgi:hypothetical protein